MSTKQKQFEDRQNPSLENEAAAQRPVADASTTQAASSGPDEQAGAPSSNTAPANCITVPGSRLLRAGVDTLFLSYPGDLSDDANIRLDSLKILARSKEPDNQKLAQIKMGDHLFQVHDRGRFPYAYILSDNWYRIQLSKPYTDQTPLAHARLSSECLTFEGAGSVEKDLFGLVSELGTVTGPPSVSWVDLCVDFVTDVDLEAIPESAWVTRASKFAAYSDNRQYSGLTIGQGGALMARLYNKSLELKTSRKEWLKEIWHDLGWQPNETVWRLEFQLRRAVLRELGIKTFDDLLAHLNGLWTYATHNWLRLTIPDPHDKTQSRWPTHPLWALLQSANWGTEAACKRRSPSTGQPPSDRSIFINGLSGVTSYMARAGVTDIASAMPDFIQHAREFHDGRAHFTGLSFDEYVEQKVALKARRYSSMHNEPPPGEMHPADAAVAKEYRRRSDGE